MSDQSELRPSADIASAALRTVVVDHGWMVAGNPDRLRAMINDVLGVDAAENRAAVDALVVASAEGIAAQLRTYDEQGRAGARPAFVQQLVEWGMQDPVAEWVINAWISVLPATTELPPTTAPQQASGSAVAPVAGTGAGGLFASATTQPPSFEPTAQPEPSPAAAAAAEPFWLPSGPADKPPRASRSRWLLPALFAAAIVVIGGAGWGVTQLTSGSGKPKPAGAGTNTSQMSSGPSTPSTTQSASASVTRSSTASKSAARRSSTAAGGGPVGANPGAGGARPAPKAQIHTVTHTATHTKTNSSLPPLVASSFSTSLTPIWSTTYQQFDFAAQSVASHVTGGSYTAVQETINTSWVTNPDPPNDRDKVTFQPQVNGSYYFTITYQVYDAKSGRTSNQASLTVTVYCNTSAPVGCQQHV